jgi:hypothetical protein
LVVMNEDTYEGVIKFRLSRLSVYIFLSSSFVFLTILTVVLIIFTPIKYYLPGVGYGDVKQVAEYRKLKIRTDSIEHELKNKQQYMDAITKVLSGNVTSKDTTQLNMPKTDNSDD